MTRYSIKITDYAFSQMEEIAKYISETLGAPDSARRFLAVMKSEMLKYSEMPARNPLLSKESWKQNGIRKIIVNNFFAYYWIDEPNKTVWFFAVIYSKRNQSTELLKAFTII